MGAEITKTRFEPDEYVFFSERLDRCLRALKSLLDRPHFGAIQGSRTIGAELELFLIDGQSEPLSLNRAIRAEALSEQLTVELAKFNLEMNLKPIEFKHQPFQALAEQIDQHLRKTNAAAEKFGGKAITIGILPTLQERHLHASQITDMPRYHALSYAARDERGSAFDLKIDGVESIDIKSDEVTAEGANTSLQIHLRVSPEEFADFYNAAQIATAPVLAVSGNSPFFLGKLLWEETRIALFRQAVDDRSDATGESWRCARVSFGNGWVRKDALELFEEAVALYPPLLPVASVEDPLQELQSGEIPDLGELRLHLGTIWRWNRAVYDPASGGHLRIEFRALPAGPTIRDMVANTAFLLGLTLAIAPRIRWFLSAMTFGQTRRNFYEAARHGLAAQLLWPQASAPSPGALDAKELVISLLEMARVGLVESGIDPEEVDTNLSIIEARARSGQTGAQWQRKMVDGYEGRLDRDASLAAMLADYARHSTAGTPVHSWPVEIGR